MGSPYHVSRCPSHLLSCDKASFEFQAISLIAGSLAHPRRALLTTFIQEAVDRELAARFFLDDVVGHDKAKIAEFLVDWIGLLRRVRPTVCENLDPSLRQSIWRRDKGRCFISKADDRKVLPVHILSPTLFQDKEMVRDGRLDTMLAVYIGRSKLESLRSLLDRDSDFPGYDPSDQLMLLSSQMLAHFANGRVSLQASTIEATSNSARYYVSTNRFIPSSRIDAFPFISLDNRAMETLSLPNPLLIGVHHQFAPATAWLEVFDHMKQSSSVSRSSTLQGRSSLAGKKTWIRRYV
ncbi:hypothetical protein HBI37_008430 [Parastagonospora nodorum]|nr:hypothetical protein HBH61_021250 [Parastagonospora nodorum]KAH4930683.1 hypothetical protein HBI79_113630 [Parastagonospora nodorum]KAH5695817.1 hypothetical protein HBI44_118510 [Parastagonospora nodorum]KAH6021833.1 hypothetical protein HBI83_095540 [Parastagonospora nodorum]KAH6235862.1 hypothetical protein HBI15_062870 [Parastagonospora nodorum]